MEGATRWQADQPLTLQLPREIELVEQFVDAMEADAALRSRFVESPVSTLVDFGIVPRDGEDAVSISRGNLIFLSIVSNRELIDWIKENQQVAEPPAEIAALYKQWLTGGGPLEIPAEYQAQILHDFAASEDFMQQLVSRLYQDAAFRSSLPDGVGEPELSALVTDTLAGIRQEVALGSLPRLQKADRTLAFVVLIPVLAIAIVAVALAVALAVVVVVWAWVWVWGIAAEKNRELEMRAGILDLAYQFAELRGAEKPW